VTDDDGVLTVRETTEKLDCSTDVLARKFMVVQRTKMNTTRSRNYGKDGVFLFHENAVRSPVVGASQAF